MDIDVMDRRLRELLAFKDKFEMMLEEELAKKAKHDQAQDKEPEDHNLSVTAAQYGVKDKEEEDG